MGEAFSKAVQPEELAVFRKLPSNTLLDNIEIPERAENRRPTDRQFLIVFFVVLGILLPFLIYTFVKSDMDRLRGYDQCGNICGKKNTKYDDIFCSGEDFTNNKYLEYEDQVSRGWQLTRRECVTRCTRGEPIFGQCFPFQNNDTLSKLGANVNDYLKENAWRLTLACLISLGVTLGMIFLFRTATAAVVWGILGGVCIFGTIVVGVLWYLYFHRDEYIDSKEDNQGLLYSCIILTIFVLVLICVIIFLHKRIQLVIQLFKEATKAIFAMPLMVFTPVLTFIGAVIIIALLATTTLIMSTAGSLQQLQSNYYTYELNPVMIFTLAYNFWMAFWGSQFLTGIQYMVVAGAVSKWYWSKDKSNLNDPIMTSAKVVFKYHLGSVALGSMIITLVAILRATITALAKNEKLKICIDYCMERIETFIKFLSKNAYILTAMHGKPFYKSGKRAARIIFQNACNIIAINSIGDFVLGMAQILIVLISLLVTYGLMQGTNQDFVWVSYVIVGIVSLATAMIFFSLFETTIDTIFLCFCEDSMLNDGMARPYAMSRNLMEFVENSKKVWVKKE